MHVLSGWVASVLVAPVGGQLQPLEPMRQRRKQYEGKDDVILDILKKGSARANLIAEETLAMVKEKANLIAFPRSVTFR